MPEKRLGPREILLTVGWFVLLFGIIFLPAGTLYWPEAWLYIALYMLSSVLFIIWAKKKDPALLKERLNIPIRKEQQGWDRILMSIYVLCYLLIIVVSGLDFRYGWSQLSVYLKAFGFVSHFFGLAVGFLVMRENTFAAQTVRIQKERKQKVVTTGPYAIVRHPLYAASPFLTFGLAFALGSLYALVPGLIMVPLILIRTFNEDKMLQKELPGYKQYCKKTRYRLLPFVW